MFDYAPRRRLSVYSVFIPLILIKRQVNYTCRKHPVTSLLWHYWLQKMPFCTTSKWEASKHFGDQVRLISSDIRPGRDLTFYEVQYVRYKIICACGDCCVCLQLLQHWSLGSEHVIKHARIHNNHGRKLCECCWRFER